jgi:Glycosyl hydrolase family 26
MIRSTLFAGLFAAAALAAAVTSSPVSAEPAGFVYKGAGCDGKSRLPRFQSVTGQKLDGVTDFLAQTNWTDMQSGAAWAIGCWQGTGLSLSLGVPMLMSDGSLAQAASGAYDDQFSKVGALLVAKGFAGAYLRIGWEFNGNWYPWAAYRDPLAFKAAFRHIVGVFRAVPGQQFRIVWNPSVGAGTGSPESLWPGDDVVDLVGIDFYNQSWRPQDIDPVVRWQNHLTEIYGLDWVSSFAVSHNKRIVVPEWATGTRPDGHGWGDDPLFIHNMAAWMRKNDVLYHGYWDFTASDFDGTMSGGNFPLTFTAYKAEYGTP